jgi:hypothetical protein
MNIKVSQNSQVYNKINITPAKNHYWSSIKNDEFIKTTPNNTTSFKGLWSLFSKKTPQEDINEKILSDTTSSEFAKRLSSGILNVMETEIEPAAFKNIMRPDEIKNILPQLQQENFISTEENQENGIYSVDLDYQTSFSSGVENVFDILTNVAEYADKYYEKTGKDFIFALTDKDNLEGVQHAVREIGLNPEKYEHVKFIPGIKMTYAHKAPNSKIGFENSEMLVYGINPFSKNLINFVDNTLYKRKNMVMGFIKKVYTLYPEFAYNVIEFAKQNTIKYKKDYGVSNLYWRAREYALTKGDTAMQGIDLVPEEIMKQADSILSNMYKVYLGSEDSGVSAHGSDIIKDEAVNHSVKKVFDDYSTHYVGDKVVSSAENLYDDMINCLSREKEKPVLAFASPYYFSHYYETQDTQTFDKVVKFMKELQRNSKNMLIAFESIGPGYDIDNNFKPSKAHMHEIHPKIDNFNQYIREHTKLYEVGGSFAKRNMT